MRCQGYLTFLAGDKSSEISFDYFGERSSFRSVRGVGRSGEVGGDILGGVERGGL